MFIIDAITGSITTVKNEMSPNSIVFVVVAVKCSVTGFAGDTIPCVCTLPRVMVCLPAVTHGIDDMGCVEIIQYIKETGQFEFTKRLQISMGECTAIDVDRRHDMLVVGSSDSILTVVDYCDMIPLSTIKLHKWVCEWVITGSTGIKRAQWTSKGEYVAFCSSDNLITLAHPMDGAVKKSYKISEYSTVRPILIS